MENAITEIPDMYHVWRMQNAVCFDLSSLEAKQIGKYDSPETKVNACAVNITELSLNTPVVS